MTDAWDLVWGIKPSFLNYVQAIPDLQIALSDDVERIEEPMAWRFPSAGGELTDDALSGGSARLDFAGSFRLTGYAGGMELTLIEPRIEFAGGTAALSVGAPAAPSVRIILATAKVDTTVRGEDGSVTLALALHPGGVGMFNGIYPPGTELAPAILTPRAS